MTDAAWQITIDPQPDRITVQVRGDLDMETAPSLLKHVEPYLDGSDVALVVDLGGLSFIDSTGLSALIRINQRMNAAGRPFEIITPRPSVAKAFQITGLNRVLPLRERTA